MPGKHAYFAPSASPRWLACPGSLALSEGIEETTSVYAHEGTVCHEVSARCLKENLTADDFSGETIDGVYMESELIEAIQMYIDEVRGQTKELGVKGGKIEHTVEITEDCWGMLDAMMWNDEWLLIADAKFGKGVIVEGDTPQMKVYAIGAMKWLQMEYSIAPQKVKTLIIQPRTVNPIRPVEYTREELIKWYMKVLRPTMEAVKNGAVKCVPGETQCRWCPAAGVCTVQAEFAIRETEQAFKPYTEVETPPPPAPDPLMDLIGMANLRKAFGFIRDWMNNIDARLLEEAIKGTEIPGLKLVRGRANRKWKVSDSQIAAFLKQHQVEPYEEKLLSPAKVEKEMGKKKSEGVGLANYITTPLGAPTLVDETDKRPAMEVSVEKQFEEFVETTVIVETATSGNPEEFEDGLKPLTLMQKLSMADMEDDPRPDPDPEDKLDAVDELFGGTSAIDIEEASNMFGDFSSSEEAATVKTRETESEDRIIIQSATLSDKILPPKKSTKRHQVLTMGKGGVSLEEVAKALGCGVNSVKMHIRYLHERDGYGYELYSDGTFKITE